MKRIILITVSVLLCLFGRCQMSNIGHPLYNDMKYGNFKSNDFYLCAYSLTFTHPITKEEMVFEMEE